MRASRQREVLQRQRLRAFQVSTEKRGLVGKQAGYQGLARVAALGCDAWVKLGMYLGPLADSSAQHGMGHESGGVSALFGADTTASPADVASSMLAMMKLHWFRCWGCLDVVRHCG